jgi:hypothetical protein
MRRFVLITAAAAVLATAVGPNGPLGGFWAASPELPTAHGPVRLGLIGEGAVENLAFGAGIAILTLGRRWFVHRIGAARPGHVAWLSAVWLLASWMPHGSLHRHVGMDPDAVLPVEWIFHAGSILATALLLWALTTTARRQQDAAPAKARAARR